MTGKVTLVSAGPGDPELLSIKGYKALMDADVVVFDRLIGKGILDMIPENAKKIDVGKNAGYHPVKQEEINEILVEEALKGNKVVRLKGGDGFLFGRGGEEITCLRNEGIEFKMIPGITSAFAAPAYAGIPVTHRDYASSVHVITGRRKKDEPLKLDYEALVKVDGTLVFMMSVSNIDEVCSKLMEHGMDENMPAAIVENGTLPSQRKVLSNLKNIAKMAVKESIISPSIIVIGRVCTLSDSFDWFSQLPLKAVRILVTRPKNDISKLKEPLLELGADVTTLPAIKIKPLAFEMPDLKKYSHILFTSANGVRGFFKSLNTMGLDSRSLHGIKIDVIGSGTARELKSMGIIPDFIAKNYDGESMVKEMIEKKIIDDRDRLLLARGNLASQELNGVLKARGIYFDEITVYETTFSKLDFSENDFDLVTFTSASCVNSFVNSLPKDVDLSRIRAVCIGEKTANEARKYDMRIEISKIATIESMVEKIKEIARNE